MINVRTTTEQAQVYPIQNIIQLWTSLLSCGACWSCSPPSSWPSFGSIISRRTCLGPNRTMEMRIDPGIFKSYDIRGVYPSELNEHAAEAIGRAFVQFLGCTSVAVGRDMRASSESLFKAFARGVTAAGADVVDLGLTSTDELYFAVGKYGYPAGVMITASHNPKEYNGFKLFRENAIALSAETGVYAIRNLVVAGRFTDSARAGRITSRDVLPNFTDHCLSFIDRDAIKPLKIVIDCGNG